MKSVFTGKLLHHPMHPLLARPFPLLAALLLLASCRTITTYDQAAYEKATAAKAEALILMDKANDPFSTHQGEVELVLLTVDKAYEYDRGRARNNLTVKQWEVLRNPTGHLFGGFVRRWREKGSLKPAYITEKRSDTAVAFDQIIELERGKPRSN